jgi:hypothetical protein
VTTPQAGAPASALELLEDAWTLMTQAHVRDEDAPPGWRENVEAWRERYHAYLKTVGGETAPEPDAAGAGGQWMEIAFMGRREVLGYVTEVLVHGQPGYHIDLPEKVWGGNPLAWEEYAATSLYSRRPVTAESVRKHWDAERARAAAWRRQQVEWEQQRAITVSAAADNEMDDDGEPETEEDYGGSREAPF